ncbi:TPA: hypothetical protein ACPWFJ_004727 [Pseudomonas aeruginosa]
MQTKASQRKALTPGDVVAILFFILGCTHITLIYVSGFNFWPQAPLVVLGGLFGLTGMFIYFMALLVIWMAAGLVIGAAVNTFKHQTI